jgi:hypothetical protein
MKHSIIKTDNYLLIVSDEIPTTWYYDTYLNQVRHTGGAEYGESSISKKVIGHLPLNNSPILEGIDLLPPLEDEVEKLAIEKYPVNMGEEWTEEGLAYPLDFNYGFRQGFIEGYNKAKEKYKYTEEDLLIIRNKLVSMLPTGDISAWDMIMATSNYTKWFDEFIQFLQQPKYPIGFECEMIDTSNVGVTLSYPLTKTTTNSQGQTVLEGKYIYE